MSSLFGVDATQYEGWFYEGAGIYRHVWLNRYNNLHVATDGVFAYSETKDTKSTISVQTTIENQNLLPSSCSVVSYLKDRGGKIVSTSSPVSLEVKPNEHKVVSQKLIINNPRLWSTDDPYLYRAVVEVVTENKVIDQSKMRFGIRTIAI